MDIETDKLTAAIVIAGINKWSTWFNDGMDGEGKPRFISPTTDTPYFEWNCVKWDIIVPVII